MSSDRPTPPRRQARGERRIIDLLSAAEAVFAEHGFEKANTNIIAARAGVSPGSLYQFFPSKDAMAEALAEAFRAEVEAAHDKAFAPGALDEPLSAIVDRVTGALLAMHRARPVLRVLLHGKDAPPALAAVTQPLHEALLTKVERLVAGRKPDWRPADRRRVAAVAVEIVTGLLPMVLAAPPASRATMERELKRALHGYLSEAEGR